MSVNQSPSKTKSQLKEKMKKSFFVIKGCQDGKLLLFVENAEKYHILMEDYKQSLNCRSELLSKCRHKSKWKLVKLL